MLGPERKLDLRIGIPSFDTANVHCSTPPREPMTDSYKAAVVEVLARMQTNQRIQVFSRWAEPINSIANLTVGPYEYRIPQVLLSSRSARTTPISRSPFTSSKRTITRRSPSWYNFGKSKVVGHLERGNGCVYHLCSERTVWYILKSWSVFSLSR